MKSTKDIAVEIFSRHEENRLSSMTSLIIEHSDYTLDEVDSMLEIASDTWELYQGRIDAFNDDMLV